MPPQSRLGLEGTSVQSAGTTTPHSALGKEAGRMGKIRELAGDKLRGPGEDLREYSSSEIGSWRDDWRL